MKDHATTWRNEERTETVPEIQEDTVANFDYEYPKPISEDAISPICGAESITPRPDVPRRTRDCHTAAPQVKHRQRHNLYPKTGES